MRFIAYEWNDNHKHYLDALFGAGYERIVTKDFSQADLLFCDMEQRGRIQQNIHKFNGKLFIWPHTPRTCWLWDGVFEALPAEMNFVAGEGQKECMRRYGYPCPVEAVGFGRCEIREFEPAKMRKPSLLIVPARPRRGKNIRDYNTFLLEFAIKHRGRFSKITFIDYRTDKHKKKCEKYGIKYIKTDFKQTKTPTADMVKRILAHDLLISMNTTGVLGVALGKPTVFYMQDTPPDTIDGATPEHFDLYKDIYAFPLTLEDMSIDEVLDTAERRNPKVEEWKVNHIGEPFDAEKFVNIVESYL